MSVSLETRPERVTVVDDPIAVAAADRYHPGRLLGSGGMADVRALQDARLGREVAIKTVRTEGEIGRKRFLREVQVQGQLEHPSIVPVYDLGTGEDGRPYFTMKRVRGLTLGQVLRELNGPGARDMARFTHRRLLSDFLTVCAIEFAHTWGSHRDPPANVMLGSR
jgi:serine/threonine-protein kinase